MRNRLHISSVVLAALALGACSSSSNGSSSGNATADAGAGFSFTPSNVDLGALGDLSTQGTLK